MIHMVEPTDPKDRAAAIKVCRANARLHIETGEPLDIETGNQQWMALSNDPDIDVPYSMWIWMWNHAQAEWNPGFADAVSEHSGG